MAVVKHIGVLSIAKVYACVSAVMGFIGSLFVIPALTAHIQLPGLLGLLVSPAAIVILPILYAIVGFVGGAIGAFFYNIVASSIGGVEIDFEGGETPTGPTKIESPY